MTSCGVFPTSCGIFPSGDFRPCSLRKATTYNIRGGGLAQLLYNVTWGRGVLKKMAFFCYIICERRLNNLVECQPISICLTQ